MSIPGLIQLACGLAVIPMALWFYPHCARRSLASRHARTGAFVLAQLGTVAAVLAGALFIGDAIGTVPREAAPAGFVLIVLWLPAPLAFLRPRWLVRATGGPARA
jgi:hypothetical protein